MKKNFTIHDLPQEERPRERLKRFGSEALSVPELLTLILGRGVNGESVITTSQKIISKFGSLKKLSEASIEDLLEIKGIGLAKAAQIQASLEIARRINQEDETRSKKRQIFTAKEVYRLAKSKVKNFSKEHLLVISFDNKNRVIGIDTVAIGNLNSNLAHPRETFEAAIKRHAANIIVVHNHPSGDTEPSREDLEITRQLVSAGKIMGIEVLDHLIIGDGYKSII